MAAYIAVLRDSPVRDPEAMAEYQRMTRANPGKHKVTPLAVYGTIEPLEGAAPDAVVLLKFDSVEEARAWYGSEGYQAALPNRLKAADYRSFIVEGI